MLQLIRSCKFQPFAKILFQTALSDEKVLVSVFSHKLVTLLHFINEEADIIDAEAILLSTKKQFSITYTINDQCLIDIDIFN